MPKFQLTKLAENEFDSNVTVTFSTDLLQSAKLHYDDFLKACGFEVPDDEELTIARDNVVNFKIPSTRDWMWDDGMIGGAGEDRFIRKEDS